MGSEGCGVKARGGGLVVWCGVGLGWLVKVCNGESGVGMQRCGIEECSVEGQVIFSSLQNVSAPTAVWSPCGLLEHILSPRTPA